MQDVPALVRLAVLPRHAHSALSMGESVLCHRGERHVRRVEGTMMSRRLTSAQYAAALSPAKGAP